MRMTVSHMRNVAIYHESTTALKVKHCEVFQCFMMRQLVVMDTDGGFVNAVNLDMRSSSKRHIKMMHSMIILFTLLTSRLAFIFESGRC